MLIEFNVAVPENTPRSADVYISGNIEELGNWNPVIKLDRITKNFCSKKIDIPECKIKTTEYKYLLGSWADSEKGHDNAEINNRKIKVDEKFRIFDKVNLWSYSSGRYNTLTGNVRFHYNFYSPQLDNYRTIIIYLPDNYEYEKNRYQVLYMHDGNNIFDAKTSFSGIEWMVDETVEKLIKMNEIEKIIVVGIYNTSDRINEYSPYIDDIRGGGKGDSYIKFIKETLKPFIDKNYRTKCGRDYTGIAGSSLGGLISLYAVFEYPEIFGKAGIISPALYWSDLKIINMIESKKLEYKLKLWIDIGTDEFEETGVLKWYENAVENCEILENAIKNQNKSSVMIDYKFSIIKGGRHNEYWWSLRTEDVLKYLFKK